MKITPSLLGLSLACALVVDASARVVTVNTINNDSPGTGETSLLMALTDQQEGDIIRFDIAGAGPHIIKTPLGGYPFITVNNLTIDGYSQTGSSPNTNPILGGNNAQIKIVLDSTDSDQADNPADPTLPLRRSTRMDYDGYGTSENGILAVLSANQFTVRGLSFIARITENSDSDPKIYCVALVAGAQNAKVQGCWMGLPPGGSKQDDVRGCGSGVTGFRYRTGGTVYDSGLVVGTDGDGVDDRAEFNIIMGMNIGVAIELPNTKIAGNYFNLFPDGKTFLDIDEYYAMQLDLSAGDSDTLENIENGRLADNTTIGTDGDGISDENERNVFNHAIYDHEIEVYSKGTNIVIAGNYFGVGVDGVTLAPLSTNAAPDFIELPGTSSIRVGSQGAGASDALESNLIVNGPGSGFVVAGSSVPIISRGNKFVNCNYLGIPFAEGQNSRTFPAYYANYMADSSLAVPALSIITNNVLVGSFGAPNGADYTTAYLDLYTVDAAALANASTWPRPLTHSSRWLATFTDNGTLDLDPAANQFAIDLSSYHLPVGTYVAVGVTYAKGPGATVSGSAITSPLSNPVAAKPTLTIRLDTVANTAEVSWLSGVDAFKLDGGTDLSPGGWVELPAAANTGGRNLIVIQYFPQAEDIQFFRLRSAQ